MNRFDYHRATSADEALHQFAGLAAGLATGAVGDAAETPLAEAAIGPRDLGTSGAAEARAPRYLAGGTNLVDLMKEGVMAPVRLVDIGRLGVGDLREIREIRDTGNGAVHLGALATNAATAYHPLVAERLPLLRSAILAGASPQIRNRATNGGNLLQRTRCLYFYDIGVPCNKRIPGSGCPAATGLARQHAILGASAHCVATHPSDLCVALAALDAEVHVIGTAGRRVIPFGEFHRLPGDRPDLDTTLAPGELITHLVVPPNSLQAHSCYLKLRERASYAFALVSVAAGFELDDTGLIVDARVALGGVAHKPWRNPDAERLLVGERPSPQLFSACAAALLKDATPCGGPALPESTPGNAFKIPLARQAVVRALEMALAGIPTNTGEDAFRALGAREDRAPTAEAP
ncbi:FAD binding domain-containing protein [Roseateles sp. UC29_93]|uniref:FAD binding domain-containing protein n=1 Tax=Roseateles sp. UC29_93 TaxID=3350177 RepID=UPI00367140F3